MLLTMMNEVFYCKRVKLLPIPEDRSRLVVLSWRWDLSQPENTSEHLVGLFRRAQQLGFKYVISDIFSLDQELGKSNLEGFMKQVELFTHLYACENILVMSSADGFMSHFCYSRLWMIAEMSKWGGNPKVLLKHIVNTSALRKRLHEHFESKPAGDTETIESVCLRMLNGELSRISVLAGMGTCRELTMDELGIVHLKIELIKQTRLREKVRERFRTQFGKADVSFLIEVFENIPIWALRCELANSQLYFSQRLVRTLTQENLLLEQLCTDQKDVERILRLMGLGSSVDEFAKLKSSERTFTSMFLETWLTNSTRERQRQGITEIACQYSLGFGYDEVTYLLERIGPHAQLLEYYNIEYIFGSARKVFFDSLKHRYQKQNIFPPREEYNPALPLFRSFAKVNINGENVTVEGLFAMTAS
jgi:hypothetical protein